MATGGVVVQIPLPLLSPGTGTSFHGTRTYHSGTIRSFVDTLRTWRKLHKFKATAPNSIALQ
eukprot:3333891-Ditylum_brightwellii.AAC.1